MRDGLYLYLVTAVGMAREKKFKKKTIFLVLLDSQLVFCFVRFLTLVVSVFPVPAGPDGAPENIK